MYNKEMLELAGEVYHKLLFVINKGKHDPFPNSEILPIKSLIMVIPKAMPIGIPDSLNRKIAELMDMIKVEDMDYFMKTPTPMELRSWWWVGWQKALN